MITLRRDARGVLARGYPLVTADLQRAAGGLNSLIQAAKRRARGYRTNRNYIAMIYLVAGKLESFMSPTRNSEEPLFVAALKC